MTTALRSDESSATGDRRPHLVQLIGQLYRGGAELQLARMLRYIDPHDWRVTVVSHWSGADAQVAAGLRAAGCAVIELGKCRRLDLPFLVRYVRTLRALKPDLVHAWLSPGAFWIRLLRPLLWRRLPIVVSFRGWLKRDAWWAPFLDRLLAKQTSVFVCNSPGLQRFWQERLAGKGREVLMIPNGVDHLRFKPSEHRDELLASLGLAGRAPVVTMVGSMYPVKNWPMFVETAVRVRQRLPQARFCAVGGGPELQAIQSMADERGLSADDITFLGESDRVADVLAASDVLLCSSRSEGMPNVILEAMASALPVVATDIDGVRSLVENGQTGILVPLDDSGTAADAIVRLHENRELGERLARAGRRLVLENHTFEAMARMHERIYRRALGEAALSRA